MIKNINCCFIDAFLQIAMSKVFAKQIMVACRVGLGGHIEIFLFIDVFLHIAMSKGFREADRGGMSPLLRHSICVKYPKHFMGTT